MLRDQSCTWGMVHIIIHLINSDHPRFSIRQPYSTELYLCSVNLHSSVSVIMNSNVLDKIYSESMLSVNSNWLAILIQVDIPFYPLLSVRKER